MDEELRICPSVFPQGKAFTRVGELTSPVAASPPKSLVVHDMAQAAPEEPPRHQGRQQEMQSHSQRCS